MTKEEIIKDLEKNLEKVEELVAGNFKDHYYEDDASLNFSKKQLYGISNKDQVFQNYKTQPKRFLIQNCKLRGISIKGDINDIELCKCIGDSLTIEDANVNTLVIEFSYIKKISIKNSKINKFRFDDRNVVEDFFLYYAEVSKGIFGDINIIENNRIYFQKLRIRNYKTSSDISFNNCEIESLELSEKFESGSFLLFENSSYQSLKLSMLKNYGEIFFFNVDLIASNNSAVDFNRSILGSITFNNFSFPTSIDIINCDFSKIKVHGVVWPSIIHTSKNGDSSKKGYNKTKEVYRDLKNVLYGQGDKVNGNYFYSKEMQAYRKSLNRKNDTYFDRIILLFNSLSDYGQNYILSSLYTLLFGIIFYGLVIVSAKFPDVDYFQKFWEFMLPTHRFDFIPQTGLSTFLDFIGRIVISVMLFITIRTFRKLN